MATVMDQGMGHPELRVHNQHRIHSAMHNKYWPLIFGLPILLSGVLLNTESAHAAEWSLQMN